MEALYSLVRPNFPLPSINSELACETGATVDSHGARPPKLQKGHSLCSLLPSLFRRSKFAFLAFAHVSLRILLRKGDRHSFEADMTGEGPDVPRGVPCSPCRQVLHDISRKRQARTLSQDVAQQFVKYNEYMRNEKLSQVAMPCDAWRADDGRRRVGVCSSGK